MLDTFAVYQHAAGTFVKRKLGLNQISMFLEKPIDAVVRSAAFLVGCQRQDQVAVRLIALALESQQSGDPDGSLRFIVRGAAPVEIAVLFEKDERIDSP